MSGKKRKGKKQSKMIWWMVWPLLQAQEIAAGYENTVSFWLLKNTLESRVHCSYNWQLNIAMHTEHCYAVL